MEGAPYALVEAMTIAGYAIGAAHGCVYLRGEYPRAYDRLSHALTSARARGLLGPDVLGQGYAFDIEIRRGAGAYICGVGCSVTLHVQDNEIVKVTSPHDNPVTHGNLCIKGRFGFQHVQNRD